MESEPEQEACRKIVVKSKFCRVFTMCVLNRRNNSVLFMSKRSRKNNNLDVISVINFYIYQLNSHSPTDFPSFVLGVKSSYLGVGVGVGILVPLILLVTAVIIVYKVRIGCPLETV